MPDRKSNTPPSFEDEVRAIHAATTPETAAHMRKLARKIGVGDETMCAWVEVASVSEQAMRDQIEAELALAKEEEAALFDRATSRKKS